MQFGSALLIRQWAVSLIVAGSRCMLLAFCIGVGEKLIVHDAPRLIAIKNFGAPGERENVVPRSGFALPPLSLSHSTTVLRRTHCH